MSKMEYKREYENKINRKWEMVNRKEIEEERIKFRETILEILKEMCAT